MGRAEEQGTLHPVRHDVVVDQRLLLVGVVSGIERHLIEASRPGHLLEGERARDDEPEDHGGDQIEGDRRDGRDDEDRRIAPGRSQERAQAGDFDHLEGRRQQDARECGERDPGDPLSRDEHDRQQGERLRDGGQSRSCARTDIDRGPGDGGGRRDAAEERDHEVGHALAEELAVRVVALTHRHAVGDRGGHQALEGGQGGDRDRRQQQLAQGLRLDRRQRWRRQADRDRPDRGDGQVGDGHDHGGDDHGQERHRDARADSCRDQHRAADQRGDADRGPFGGGEPRRDRSDRDRHDRIASSSHAEGGRQLLEGDDDRDPDREALDYGQRDVLHVASRPSERQADQQHPCQDPDHEDAGHPELGDDRDQDDGHRTRRSADLEMAATEQGGEDPGDDGGHEARFGSETRCDPERQRQGQRDDGHRDAGHHVASRLPAHRLQVGRPRGDRSSASHQRLEDGVHSAPGVCRESVAHAVTPSVRSWALSSSWSAMRPSRIVRAASSRSRTSATRIE